MEPSDTFSSATGDFFGPHPVREFKPARRDTQLLKGIYNIDGMFNYSAPRLSSVAYSDECQLRNLKKGGHIMTDAPLVWVKGNPEPKFQRALKSQFFFLPN